MELTTKQLSMKNLALATIDKLKLRGIDGYYCDNSLAAISILENMIKENSTIGFGGSETLKESGILDFLRRGNYILYDRANAKTKEESKHMYANHVLSDYFFMSSNAVTYDGLLVNIDGTGNRTACLIHGPQNVIVVIGTNKLVENETAAISRVRNIAAPPNAIRLNRDTPCNKLGRCTDCFVNDCMCCNTVITRKSYIKGRIKVIIINENLGY